MNNLSYPIGVFKAPSAFTKEGRQAAIEVICRFPSDLEEVLKEIKEVDWEKTYRPQGWTVRQLVHHCADSHMNSFIRFKLSLTEDGPTIKPYLEDRWALQNDYSPKLISASLEIIRALHSRWGALLSGMADSQWYRSYFHPEQNRLVSLDEAVLLYAWHCRHHLKHIEVALGKW